MNKTVYEYAVAYRKMGWSVIPVPVGRKIPAIPWKKYQEQYATDEELRSWFFNKNTNIGLVTGRISNVIVVDEDSYKSEFERIIAPSPVRVRTGGGGVHHYFRYSEGVRNAVLKSKTDIRGDGGYVLLPPSIHSSGNSYTWINDMTKRAEIPPLPQDFLSLTHNETTEKLSVVDSLNVSQGGRNDAMYRLMCSLLNHYDKVAVWNMVQAINLGYKPPLEKSELQASFRSAVAYIEKNPVVKGTTVQPDSTSILRTYKGSEAQLNYDKKIEEYGDGLSTGIKDIDVMFRLYPEHLYQVAAGTHVGKTTFMATIAAHVAKEGKRVMFLSLEDGLWIVPKIQKIINPIPDNFLITDAQGFPTATMVREEVERWGKPDLLIVDHVHFFASEQEKETMKDRIAQVATEMKVFTKQMQIPVISAAHIRKQNTRGKDIAPTNDDLKDAQELAGLANVIAILHREKNDELELVGELSTAGYLKNEGSLIVTKAKVPNGRTGIVPFKMKGEQFISFGSQDLAPQAVRERADLR